MTDLGPSPVSVEQAIAMLATREPLVVPMDIWPRTKANRRAIQEGILVLDAGEQAPIMLRHIAPIILRVEEDGVTVLKRRSRA